MKIIPGSQQPEILAGSEVLLTDLDPPLGANLRRVLNRAGYRTVDEVVEATDAQLLTVRGIGDFSVLVLREALDHMVVRQPLEPVRLDALRHELRDRIVNLLKRDGYRTAEEVAVVTNADLLDLPQLGEPSLAALRSVTGDVLAKNYTSRKPVTFTASQVREIVAVVAALAPYADQENHRDVRRRAQGLLETLAPGFPTSEASLYQLLPDTEDHHRTPLMVVKDVSSDGERESTVPR